MTSLLAVLGWLFVSTAAAAAAQNVPAPEGQVAASEPGDDYVLQAGDQVAIRVFNHPELEDTVQIRPDGRISVLLADNLPAAGVTSSELDKRLTEIYSRLYRDVELSVIVRTFSNNKVYVGGEVGQPGLLAITGRVTALTAVFQAGGFRNTARTDSVMLLRNRGGKPDAMRLDLKAVLAGRSPDVSLQPFDVVYVPMSRIAKVDLFVDQYIRQLIPIGTSAGFTYIFGENAIVLPR